MSDSERKSNLRADDLPTTRTPSGRLVYDPEHAPKPTHDPEVLRGMLEGMHRIETADARDAIPAPVEVAKAGDGALVAAGEAAAKAHAEAVIAPQAVPNLPSAPLRIAAALDPRKQTTGRMLRSVPAPANEAAHAGATEADAAPQSSWAREPKGHALDKEAMPSARAPRSSPPPNVKASRTADAGTPARDRRWLALLLAVAVFGVVLAVLRVHRSDHEDGGTSTSPAAATASGTTGVPVGPGTSASAPPVAATASESTTSVDVAPSTSSTSVSEPAPTGADTASPTVAPRTTAPSKSAADPYADAGAAPKTTATAEPSSPPVATTAAAAPSAAPSSKPAATASPAPSGSSFLFRPKGDDSP